MPELTDNRWMSGVLMIAVVMLTACAGAWRPIQGDLTAPQWSLSAPEGWMHLSMPESEMLTKNGPYLEYMLIQSRPLAASKVQEPWSTSTAMAWVWGKSTASPFLSYE